MPSLRKRLLMPALALLAALTWCFLSLGGCAPKRVLSQPETARPAVLAPGPPAPGAPAKSARSSKGSQQGLEVANLALTQLGRPYRWGGSEPRRGLDCSGLVQWSYRSVGIDLPRVVSDQRQSGRSIDSRRLQPGDLVFFRIHGNRTSHVGIYVGDGQFVHAPRTGQPVRTDRLNDPYWRERWTETRRIF